MPTSRLLPTANGYANTWPVLVGAASHWQAVTSDDGGTSYVEMSGGGSNNAEFFAMGPNPAATEITAVSLGAKGAITVNVVSPSDEVARFHVRTVSAGVGAYSFEDRHAGTHGFSLFSGAAVRPGGGSFIPGDFAGIQAGATFPYGGTNSEYQMSYIYIDATYLMAEDGFACLVGSLVGAALGLAEMANLARAVNRIKRTLIAPDEYEAAWRDIRGHRWPTTFEMRGALCV